MIDDQFEKDDGDEEKCSWNNFFLNSIDVIDIKRKTETGKFV